MIELDPEQRQAMAQGQPVRIIDPLTHDAYVLVRAEEYARLAEVPQRPAGQPNPEIQPMMLRSQQAFWRDLPGLLMDRRNHRKWAAYHGEERVAIARSKVDAYQECFRRGLNRGEFYVGKLEPDPDGIPPWGTIECDRSLYEATDPDEPHSTTNEDPRSTAHPGGSHVAAVRRPVRHDPRQPDPGVGERPPARGPRARGEHPEVPGPAGHREQLRLLGAGPAPARVGRDRPRPAGSPREHHDRREGRHCAGRRRSGCTRTSPAGRTRPAAGRRSGWI